MEDKRKKYIESAKKKVKEAYIGEEFNIIQAVKAYKEAEEMKNNIYERLTDWAKPVLNLKAASPEGTSKELAERQTEEHFKQMGRIIEELDRLQALLKDFIAKKTETYAKNVRYIVEDPILTGELIEKAGSIEKLALMPASTIQLLGAEKALFKHIKYGGRLPKYGIIFKHRLVGQGSKEKRGSIARALAAKIAIAARADAYTKNFVAEKLKRDLEKSLKVGN
ncbi:MAG: hypothetical protein QXL16_00300 [Candidatus Micrarchaeaceae archaeon]